MKRARDEEDEKLSDMSDTELSALISPPPMTSNSANAANPLTTNSNLSNPLLQLEGGIFDVSESDSDSDQDIHSARLPDTLIKARLSANQANMADVMRNMTGEQISRYE